MKQQSEGSKLGQTCGRPKTPFLCKKYKKQPKTSQKWLVFGWFLVEVAGLELAASSTRSRKNMFFEHHCLHIVRIFREIISFCTFVPFIPYRTFLVVVSYVVKPFLLCKRFDSGQLKMENWKLKNFYPPLTNHTRVKKYARNIRLVCCILTLKRRKGKSFWWQKSYQP